METSGIKHLWSVWQITGSAGTLISAIHVYGNRKAQYYSNSISDPTDQVNVDKLINQLNRFKQREDSLVQYQPAPWLFFGITEEDAREYAEKGKLPSRIN